MKGFIMSRQFPTVLASLALILLGLAPFPLRADAPASDVTGNLLTNRILLIGAWRIEAGQLKGTIVHFTTAGTVRIYLKGEMVGEAAAFDVAGNSIKTTRKRADGTTSEHSTKISKLTERELVVEDDGEIHKLRRM
jgi:hypothetical protein